MRIVDRKFVDKTYTTRTRQHFGALLGEKPRNGASSTYVSTFDYQ
jgi:hypothetical protein